MDGDSSLRLRNYYDWQRAPTHCRLDLPQEIDAGRLFGSAVADFLNLSVDLHFRPILRYISDQ